MITSEPSMEHKDWKHRFRESVSSIASMNAISVSDVHEEQQCCCCINWYNDRKRENKIKKARMGSNYKYKKYNNNNNNNHNNNNNNINNNNNSKRRTKQKILIEIPRSDAQKLKNIFKQFDTDNDGALNRDDLGLAMKQLGFDMTHSIKKLDEMFNKADLDNDGKINFQEFALAIIKKAPYLFAKPQNDELKFVFDIFDVDKDGFISTEDLRSAFELQGISLSKTEILKMIINVKNKKNQNNQNQNNNNDNNNDQSWKDGISFDDFKFMMLHFNEDDHIGLFSFNTGCTFKSPPPPLSNDDDDNNDIHQHEHKANTYSDEDDLNEETVELIVNQRNKQND